MANNNNNAQGGQPDFAAILAALQQTVTQLTQGQQALVQGQQAIVNQLQPNAVAFHRSPARSNLNDLLDLTSRSGKAIYEETQKGDETKYDLSKPGLVPFTTSIKQAAQRLGCATGASSVTNFTPADGQTAVNIIDHYGNLSLERITAQSAIFTTGAHAETRQGQNNTLLADYVLNSLTKEAHRKILTYKSEFTFVHDGEEFYSFPLLWKKIVSVPSLDNKLTDTNIRDKIRGMPAKINKLSISDWNDEFTGYMNQLDARGSDIDDPVTVILEAYILADDCRFRRYWELRKMEIDDGEGTLANADWETILSRGIVKFNAYEDDWGRKSEEEEHFLALASQYESEMNALRGQLELKNPPKASAAKKTKGKSTTSSTKAKPAGQTTKNKKPTADRKRQKKDEAWKKTPPKEGEPTTKTVDGWTCHWCVHHMSWCGHSSNDCELGKRRAQEQQQQRSYKAAVASTSKVDPAVQHQQSFMAKLAGLSRLHE